MRGMGVTGAGAISWSIGCVLIAGCAIPPAMPPAGGGDPKSREARVEGPVLYDVVFAGPPLPSVGREEAEAEALRVVGGFLGSIFEEASPAPRSVREAAARFPERVRKEYGPLALVIIDATEVPAFLTWGYAVRVTLRIHDLRAWVDRHWRGYGEPGDDPLPPLHLEDHAAGWAERSFLSRSGDAEHLLGEALLAALSSMEEVLRGNPWIDDFYRLPGRRDALEEGPALSPRTPRGEEAR